MALGDKATVLIDAGQRQPEEVVITAGSVGGTVDYELEDGFVKVRERSRKGNAIQTLVVRPERLVSVHVKPRR